MDIKVTIDLGPNLLNLLANFMAGGDIQQAIAAQKKATDEANAALAAAQTAAS